MATIEREAKNSKYRSPNPKDKAKAGGWFSCQTCTIKSARIS